MIKALRERRIAQFLLTYAAAGWLILQLVDQVVDRSVFPEVVYRVALTLVLCALPGAVTLSWFHGAKGHQRAPSAEKWMLGAVGLFAVGASVFVARANANVPQAMAAELMPYEDPSRVAVLYFDAQSTEEKANVLAVGLTETLIDELSAVDALHVISRNGSRVYRDSGLSADSIGRALGVGTLVSGRVAVADERVRVTVSTVSAADGSQLETARIELPRADLFDLQDSLSVQVARFLRTAIGEELGAIQRRRETDVVEAWELVQVAAEAEASADAVLSHGDAEAASRELARADTALSQAEEADRDWVLPVVRRGWLAYRQSRLGGFDRRAYDRWIAQGLGHAERALARAPSDPDALELKGTLLYWRYLLNLAGDSHDADDTFHEAESLLRASIAQSSGQASAMTSLSHLLLNKGETAQAKLMAQRSYEADPFLENAHLTLWRLARSSWDLGDDVEARRWCDEGLGRYPEDYRFRQCQLMLFALPGTGPDIAAAWAWLDEFVELSPPQSRALHEHQGLQYVAMALTRAGLPDSARAVARRGRADADVDPVRDLALLESISRSWLGDFDEAVDLMSLYLAANPSLVEAYATSIEVGDIHWYHRELAERPEFRLLLGAT